MLPDVDAKRTANMTHDEQAQPNGDSGMTNAEWWRGKKHDQSTHERINARHYPGTRQLCKLCDEPTGRCEDDSMYDSDNGPLCETCYLGAIGEVSQ